MKKYAAKFAPFLIMIGISSVFAPVQRAQVSVATRIVTVPDGMYYFVDGTEYRTSTAFMWTAGSRHSMYVLQPVQEWQSPGTRYTFTGWQGGEAAQTSIFAEANPLITEYKANFKAEYRVIIHFLCGGNPCAADRVSYFEPGAILTPDPLDGWVFSEWLNSSGYPLSVPQSSFKVFGPMTLYATYLPVRTVTLDSSPPNLMVMVDGSPIVPPYTVQWASSSVHPVDAVTPQRDRMGRLWVFEAWSDGGERQHGYRVPASGGDASLTATFVPGVTGAIWTTPIGLRLTIDGRNDPPPYGFTWRAGDTHRLDAPAEQTDAQGRLWTFSEWSNGVTSRTQEFVVPAEGQWPTAIYTLVGLLTVSADISGVPVKVDGADCATPCEVKRPAGTQVRVSAPSPVRLSEATRAEFSGWTGSAPGGTGDWVATLNGDPLAIRASYRRLNRLSAVADPAGSAAWVFAPASPDAFYDEGANVSVSVTAAPGYRFLRWEGDIAGATPAGVVAMSAPRSVRAVFELSPVGPWAQVFNAAGETPKPGVAPGSAISVFGSGLAAATEVGPASPLRQTLGGITARVGERLLPLYFVSPTQVNLQLPPDLPPGKQTLTIFPEGMAAVKADFTVVTNAPGIFTYMAKEQTLAVALHEDRTLVSPDSPARRGELLSLYVTGLGPLDHPRPEGFGIPETPAFLALDPVSVLIGDAVVLAESAFAAPGGVGVDIVRFRLGVGTPAGPLAPLRVRVKDQESNTAPLPVQ